MNIILLGAPGAGKGTQAKALNNKLNIPQISTGDLFREEMAQGTKLGKKITQLMNRGRLVSDETTLQVFSQRLAQPDCSNGVIMDGVPRTLAQAKMIDALFSKLNKTIDHVLYINLPDEEILARLTGRWTCQKCGLVYHERYNPPKTPGICDLDQGTLYQREDQQEGAVRERIIVYKTLTEPLIDYYKNKQLLIEIDGQKPIAEVTKDIFKKLGL